MLNIILFVQPYVAALMILIGVIIFIRQIISYTIVVCTDGAPAVANWIVQGWVTAFSVIFILTGFYIAFW